MEIINYEEYLPFWKDLTEVEQNLIIVNSVPVHYDKGTLLYRAEQSCKGLMLIQKGQLRTYIVSEEGREVTLFRIRDKETCVLSASCLLDSIVFDIFIDAVEDTDAVMIPSATLSAIMKAQPKAELYLYKAATERFSDVMWTMQQILFLGADKRVAIFLWDEISQTGNDVIHLTHEEIARYIGSAREVVTKVLKYFAQEQIVSLQRGKIEVIDKEKLKMYL